MQLDIHQASYRTLNDRLTFLHARMLEMAPGIARVSCALYDERDDLLKTFLNSTRQGTSLRAYQYRLSDSESLSRLARTRDLRLLSDLQESLEPTSQHSQYLLSEGFESSFTVPMSHGDNFLGFVFFDARDNDTFTPEVQRELVLYANLMAMAIANELTAVQAIVSTVQIARDFTAFRDGETGAHLERMARYTHLILHDVAEDLDLSDEFIEQVFLYAPLHDVGKVAIPDHILLKPGRLTPEEWEIMKTHTTRGRQMVEEITAKLGVQGTVDNSVLLNVVGSHHEKLDGSGYPEGLVGDTIPIEAQIVAVADIFDALTCARPYKRAWPIDEAMVELRRQVDDGKLADRFVTAMENNLTEVARIHASFVDPPLSGTG